MHIEINRVIAAKDAAGKSVFVDLGEPYSEPVGGLGIVNVWGTELGVPTVTSGEAPQPAHLSVLPRPGSKPPRGRFLPAGLGDGRRKHAPRRTQKWCSPV